MKAEVYDDGDYWSHVVIEPMRGATRIIKGTWGPYVVHADPEFPYLVLMIDNDGDEWFTSINRTYGEALASAMEEAGKFGSIPVKSIEVAGHC